LGWRTDAHHEDWPCSREEEAIFQRVLVVITECSDTEPVIFSVTESAGKDHNFEVHRFLCYVFTFLFSDFYNIYMQKTCIQIGSRFPGYF
jgi:hypothetical protein